MGLEGLDGEIIVGSPTAKDVYRKTNSVVMSQDKVEPFLFFCFDFWNNLKDTYDVRMTELEYHLHRLHPNIIFLKPHRISDQRELNAYEQQCLLEGYEGVVLRSMSGQYKYGRTTLKEQNAWKLKRYMDSEAVVVGIAEEMENTNEATVNELGRTKRSIHQAGMVGKGTMGALEVRDLVTGVEFNIGTGFDAKDRANLDWIGKTVKYKYFPVGIKDKPRHPVYLGLRDMEIDG
jgi:DNA ligase-1